MLCPEAAIHIILNKFSHVSIFATTSWAFKTSLSARIASRSGQFLGKFSDTNAFNGRMSISYLA
jgi:hypothetical protein